MNSYLAIPVSDKYIQMSDTLYRKLKDKTTEPQGEEASKCVVLLFDEIFNQLTDEFIIQTKINSRSIKILVQLVRISRKTINTLLTKVICHLTNKDLYILVKIVKKSEMTFDGVNCFSLLAGKEIEESIDKFLMYVENENPRMAKKYQKAIILQFISLCINRYVFELMSSVKLGTISRKIVHSSVKALEKALPLGVNKMVDEFHDDELIPIRDYLIQFLQKV